ncbi:hypothetical protein U717_10610 [Rhodobacter capsulatus R121]|nr:hypothetical protein U714_10455 [Rhodobacter capsulatus DE442]ETD76905.1 hypothetical protein U717_10610 [Rhodobacter capsulatus R121]ETE53741.1 hypothetical protein U715_10610 [Rhodobacter capsulatus Y262]
MKRATISRRIHVSRQAAPFARVGNSPAKLIAEMELIIEIGRQRRETANQFSEFAIAIFKR